MGMGFLDFFSSPLSNFINVAITSAHLSDPTWKITVLLGPSLALKTAFKRWRNHHPNLIDGETEGQQREMTAICVSMLGGLSTRPDKCWSGNKYSSWWLWSLWSGLRVETFAQGLHAETTESPTAPLHFIKSHCFCEKWGLLELSALIIKSCVFEWLLPC